MGVGASTCASGNQVCKGTKGNLMAKPMNNNQNPQARPDKPPNKNPDCGLNKLFGWQLCGSLNTCKSKL